MYSEHYGEIVPDESRMSSKYGDISNSYPHDEAIPEQYRLPLCQNSYVLYNFGFGPTAEVGGNPFHNRLHQIENIIPFIENKWPPNQENTQLGQSIFWGDFSEYIQSYTVRNYRSSCGNAHMTPNWTDKDAGYGYGMTTPREFNCETWNPDDSKTSYINAGCERWGCTDKGFYKWYMQNIPGYNNGIVYQGLKMRNWWEAMYDFNTFIDKRRSLFETDLVPSPTPSPDPTFGQAIIIAANSSQPSFVQIPYSLTTLMQASAFTIGAWVKPDGKSLLEDSNTRYIIAAETDSQSLIRYSLGINNKRSEFRFYLGEKTNPNSQILVRGNTILEADRWYHIVGIKQHNSAFLFINGVIDKDPVGFVDVDGYKENENIAIGCLKIKGLNNCFDSSQFFGEIDEILLLSSTPLPPTETNPPLPSIINEYTQYLFHFDGNLEDSSNNRNNGTVYGNVEFVYSTILGLPPTPTPTFTQTPTSTPTPSPKPTPTPTLNHPPLITNAIDLPSGKVGQKYTQIIRGYDIDLTDTPTMTMTNLPSGLAQGYCNTYIISAKKYLDCLINGFPKVAGSYTPIITLKDDRGGSATKKLFLTINP